LAQATARLDERPPARGDLGIRRRCRRRPAARLRSGLGLTLEEKDVNLPRNKARDRVLARPANRPDRGRQEVSVCFTFDSISLDLILG